MTKCWPNLLKNLVLFLCCIILCLYEFSHITIKTIQGDSFQSINELHFEELYAPVFMSCTSLEKTCPIYQFLYWIPKCHFFLGRNISPWDFEDLEKQKSISYLGNLFFLLWIVFHYAKNAVFYSTLSVEDWRENWNLLLWFWYSFNCFWWDFGALFGLVYPFNLCQFHWYDCKTSIKGFFMV